MTMKASRVNLVDFIEIYITCLWKLPFPVITCWRLEEPTTAWSQIKHLETLLFCLFYICYTRSLLPLSPGTGFTYFLLTATQPQLCTQVNCSNWDCSNCNCSTLFGKYHLPDSKMSTAQNWLICLYTTRMAYGQNTLGCFGFW